MFVCMFCTSVRVYECVWRGGGRYVFCKSGIIAIPHLNISISFAMFNLLRGAIFQGQILPGGGGGGSRLDV